MSSIPSTPVTETILPATPAGVLRAAELLTQGKLVILPTETVYGIALNLLSADARHKARQAKQRAQEANAVTGTEPAHSAPRFSPWVLHVAQPEDIFSWAPHVTPLARRLISKSLPGPVAFQIKLDEASLKAARERLGEAADETLHNPEEGPERYVTLRCPDSSLAQSVIAHMQQPVAIIGAGTRNQPAIYDLQELPASLAADSEIAAALDGGPTRYRKPSTVVRIDGNAYSVVRAGVIDGRLFDKLADFMVLFICSGNTCRSPMAAALATQQIAAKLGVKPRELPLRHIVIQSAGISASRGMRAALEAQDAVREMGADLSTHLSQPATIDLLRRADVIYTMTDAHRDEVLDLFPGAERKTIRLDPEGDVADPIGAPLSVYERVANRLAEVIEERLNELPL